jgi:hypothetical protein
VSILLENLNSIEATTADEKFLSSCPQNTPITGIDPEELMKNSTECQWEEFPSFTNVLSVILDAFMKTILHYDNFINCSTASLWYQKITSADVIAVLLLIPALVLLKSQSITWILQLLRTRFENTESDLIRASDTIYELLTRSVVVSWTLYEVIVAPNCSYMKAPAQVMIENEETGQQTHMWFSRQMLFQLTVSRYVAAFVDVFVAEKRRDTIFLVVHHVIAVPLVALAYRTMPDAGLTVLFLHEVCDLSLELAKVMHYLQTSKKRVTSRNIRLVSEVAFATFFVKWFIFRMYIFPVRCLYHAAVRMEVSPCHSGTYAMAVLLNSIIYILNSIWSLMIIRGLINRLVLNRFTDETMDTPHEQMTSTQEEKIKSM